MRKRATLFDIDGTLVDSNDAHVEAWRQAFEREGYAFSRAEIHAEIGQGGDNLVPALLPGAERGLEQRLAAAENAIFRTIFLPRVQPFAGARDLLAMLAEQGHRIVLASSASRSEVDFYIDLLHARDLLSGSTSRDDVQRSKPCPDIFAAALALAGHPAAEAVVIGDSPFDIIAAGRAGIDAIALLSGGFSAAELAALRPLALYRDVAELGADYRNSPLCRPGPAAAG